MGRNARIDENARVFAGKILQGEVECATLQSMTTLSKNGKRIGRPPGKISREENKRRHPDGPGSKEKAIADLTRYVSSPDAPMVPPHLASRLAESASMAVAPSKLFEDNGHALLAVRWLAARAEHASPPLTPSATFEVFEAFMGWCGDNRVPPTIGAWAVWNGVTMQRMNQIEQDKRDEARARAYGVCKEVLRTFMEQAAWNSALNPLLYFHAQKALYGIVENTQVTVRVEDNTSDLTPDEYAERLVLLTQGEDGVYRE